MFRIAAIGVSAAALMSGTAAFAESQATASTDLNMRSGPGPMYEIVGLIPADASVTVEGCLEAENWCRVSREGTEGWAYGAYLVTTLEQEPVDLTTERARTVVSTVTYEEAGGNTFAGGAAGAIVGAIIGGPAGAALGAAAGLGASAVTAPDTRVVTHVRENPVEPVYLSGEVVVGAAVPETVDLIEIPESDLTYAYVNGVPVILDRSTRQIIHIVR